MLYEFNAAKFCQDRQELQRPGQDTNLTYACKLQAIENILKVMATQSASPAPINSNGYIGNIRGMENDIYTLVDHLVPRTAAAADFIPAFSQQVAHGLAAVDQLTLRTEPPHAFDDNAPNQKLLSEAKNRARGYLISLAREVAKVTPGLEEALTEKGISLAKEKTPSRK